MSTERKSRFVCDGCGKKGPWRSCSSYGAFQDEPAWQAVTMWLVGPHEKWTREYHGPHSLTATQLDAGERFPPMEHYCGACAANRKTLEDGQ